jgi:hypothetical protein
MRKYYLTMVVMAVFAIGFAASDDESSSSTSTQTESAKAQEEAPKPKLPKCRTCGKEFNPEEEYAVNGLDDPKSKEYCYGDYPQTCGTCGKRYTQNSTSSEYRKYVCFGTCGECYYKHLKGYPGY